MIQKIIGEVEDITIAIYIDDIHLAAATKESLLKGLDIVLGRLNEANLRVSLSKCSFLTDQVQAFGYLIDESGIRPDPKRVEKLTKIPFPATKKQMLSVLAAMNYFRGCIKSFSPLAAPLYRLTRDSVEYECTATSESDFERLKEAVSSAILLSPITDSDEFIVETDASVCGTSGVLKQKDKDGNERVVSLTSAGLRGAERLWDISNLELLALFRGLSSFEKFIENKRFLIRTDNISVYYLLNNRFDRVEVTRRSPASRFLIYVSTFDFTIKHVSGDAASFALTDLLSRILTIDENYRLILSPDSKKPLLNIRYRQDGNEKWVNLDSETVHVDSIKVDDMVKRVSASDLQKQIRLMDNHC